MKRIVTLHSTGISTETNLRLFRSYLETREVEIAALLKKKIENSYLNGTDGFEVIFEDFDITFECDFQPNPWFLFEMIYKEVNKKIILLKKDKKKLLAI